MTLPEVRLRQALAAHRIRSKPLRLYHSHWLDGIKLTCLVNRYNEPTSGMASSWPMIARAYALGYGTGPITSREIDIAGLVFDLTTVTVSRSHGE